MGNVRIGKYADCVRPNTFVYISARPARFPGEESVPKKLSTTFNVRRAALVSLEVPEGRHNVAHRETVGYRMRSFTAPKGRHIWVALCRPFGAWPSASTHTHRSRGGLRSFAPDGAGGDDKGDSSFCGTDSYPAFLTMIRVSGSVVTHFAVECGVGWRERPAGDSGNSVAAQNRRRDAGATNPRSLSKIRREQSSCYIRCEKSSLTTLA